MKDEEDYRIDRGIRHGIYWRRNRSRLELLR
jgi:hypothetical protein